jgi:hypothetical protein
MYLHKIAKQDAKTQNLKQNAKLKKKKIKTKRKLTFSFKTHKTYSGVLGVALEGAYIRRVDSGAVDEQNYQPHT